MLYNYSQVHKRKAFLLLLLSSQIWFTSFKEHYMKSLWWLIPSRTEYWAVMKPVLLLSTVSLPCLVMASKLLANAMSIFPGLLPPNARKRHAHADAQKKKYKKSCDERRGERREERGDERRGKGNEEIDKPKRKVKKRSDRRSDETHFSLAAAEISSLWPILTLGLST